MGLYQGPKLTDLPADHTSLLIPSRGGGELS